GGGGGRGRCGKGASGRGMAERASLSCEGGGAGRAVLGGGGDGMCGWGGSGCRTGWHEASHVLRAMNPNGDGARRSLRFSFGIFNTEAEIDRAIEIVSKVIEKLRATTVQGALAAAAT